jgi:hypothetical protein
MCVDTCEQEVGLLIWDGRKAALEPEERRASAELCRNGAVGDVGLVELVEGTRVVDGR